MIWRSLNTNPQRCYWPCNNELHHDSVWNHDPHHLLQHTVLDAKKIKKKSANSLIGWGAEQIFQEIHLPVNQRNPERGCERKKGFPLDPADLLDPGDPANTAWLTCWMKPGLCLRASAFRPRRCLSSPGCWPAEAAKCRPSGESLLETPNPWDTETGIWLY